MTDAQILVQLLYGHHLSDKELERAKSILTRLNTELNSRKN